MQRMMRVPQRVGGDNVGWITQCLESGHADCSDVCCALCNAMAIGINNIPSLPPLVDPVGSWGLDESHQFTPLPVVQSLLSTVLLSFIIHHWLIFCSFCGLRHQNPYCSLAVSLDPSGDFWQTPLPKPALKMFWRSLLPNVSLVFKATTPAYLDCIKEDGSNVKHIPYDNSVGDTSVCS